ncbi:unnamed protein product, partial [Prorocentrum cordatum]
AAVVPGLRNRGLAEFGVLSEALEQISSEKFECHAEGRITLLYLGVLDWFSVPEDQGNLEGKKPEEDIGMLSEKYNGQGHKGRIKVTSVKELVVQVLGYVFELAVQYDLINVTTLATIERPRRRWQTLLEAQVKHPASPGYELSRRFSGYDRGRQVVAPFVGLFEAKEVMEEAEIGKRTSKAKALKDEARL